MIYTILGRLFNYVFIRSVFHQKNREGQTVASANPPTKNSGQKSVYPSIINISHEIDKVKRNKIQLNEAPFGAGYLTYWWVKLA